MTRYLTVEEVIAAHDREVPNAPIIDRHLLESAVAQPQQTFDGQDLYPDVHHKAAALMRSLAANHSFQDGNKRASVLAVFLFYGFNGYHLAADHLELVHVAVDVVLGEYECRSSPRCFHCGRCRSRTIRETRKAHRSTPTHRIGHVFGGMSPKRCPKTEGGDSVVSRG